MSNTTDLPPRGETSMPAMINSVFVRSLQDVRYHAERMVLAGTAPSWAMKVNDATLPPSAAHELAVAKTEQGIYLCLALNIPVPIGIYNLVWINGRLSVWGDLLPALCKRSTLWEPAGFVEGHTGTFGTDDFAAYCQVQRKGENPVKVVYTWGDAKRAKLTTKPGPWTENPRRMMLMRARSFALRDAFPDVLQGLVTAEELGYDPDRAASGEVTVNEPAPEPAKRLAEIVQRPALPEARVVVEAVATPAPAAVEIEPAAAPLPSPPAVAGNPFAAALAPAVVEPASEPAEVAPVSPAAPPAAVPAAPPPAPGNPFAAALAGKAEPAQPEPASAGPRRIADCTPEEIADALNQYVSDEADANGLSVQDAASRILSFKWRGEWRVAASGDAKEFLARSEGDKELRMLANAIAHDFPEAFPLLADEYAPAAAKAVQIGRQ
jgi:hypothetical protein